MSLVSGLRAVLPEPTQQPFDDNVTEKKAHSTSLQTVRKGTGKFWENFTLFFFIIFLNSKILNFDIF
jgi:hypothetical protein